MPRLRLLALIAVLVAIGVPAFVVRAQQPSAPPASTATQKRIALLIGNSAYRHTGPLRNPVNDVREMAKALRERGFDVSAQENLDQKAMKRAVNDFGSRLRSADVALFFYAGHGMQVNGQNYMLPVDADINDEHDVDGESVNVGAVLDRMESGQNRVNIMILDACRDNPFARRFRSSRRGWADIGSRVDTFLAYATAPGSVAADGTGANSPYTAALTQTIRIPGLQIEEVFKRVRRIVRSQTQGTQTPEERSSLEADFLFTPAALSQARSPGPSTESVSLNGSYVGDVTGQAYGRPLDMRVRFTVAQQGQNISVNWRAPIGVTGTAVGVLEGSRIRDLRIHQATPCGGLFVATARAEADGNVVVGEYSGNDCRGYVKASFRVIRGAVDTAATGVTEPDQLVERGWIRVQQGKLVDGLADFEQARKRAVEVNDAKYHAHALTSLGVVRNMQGQHADALRDLERALRIARRRHDEHQQSWIALSIAIAHAGLSQREEMLDAAEEALALSERQNNEENVAYALAIIGAGRAYEDDRKKSEAALARALEIAERLKLPARDQIRATYSRVRDAKGSNTP